MKFQLDINLDDPTEIEFILSKKCHGQRLAGHLDLKGAGAANLANALLAYARHKKAAMTLRGAGAIQPALKREAICDQIYRTDIQPRCEAW